MNKTLSEYDDFPPFLYFYNILRLAPESALLYAQLWSNHDREMAVYEKTEIARIFLISPTLFRNRLMKIMEFGLASVEESPNFFTIELMPQYEYDEE